MDRTAAPWRVLEEPHPDGDGPDEPIPGDLTGRVGVTKGGHAGARTHAAGQDRVSLPIGWLIAGTVLAAAAAALAIALVVGGMNPAIALPAGANDSTTAGSIGRAGSSNPGTGGGPSESTNGSGVGTDGARGGGLVVEVAGAVARPGLYHLAAGSRVADAIAAAGGYSRRVDATRTTAAVNLAAHLADGDRVLVPSRDDPAATRGGSGGSASVGADGSSSSPGGAAGSALLDLNRATAAELDALPGIGPVTAAKIVAARQERPFRSVAELRERKLVGPSVFARLRSLVTVH